MLNYLSGRSGNGLCQSVHPRFCRRTACRHNRQSAYRCDTADALPRHSLFTAKELRKGLVHITSKAFLAISFYCQDSLMSLSRACRGSVTNRFYHPETNADMKKLRIFGPMIENKKYIHWMALFGLVVIIGLQGMWLWNTYHIQAELNQTVNFFSRMGLLLAATAMMMLFVIFCIVWQVKILRRMSRVLRIREDFSYAMVHDLKTPLSSIIMTLRPLHEGRLDDKPALRDRYFQIARDEADHLLALTNKILTISKLENHKMHMSPEPLPLQPLLGALAERLAPKCPKPLRITADLRVPTLLADPEYWPEVMQNLVDNAIKYTRPDADAVEIHVSTRPAGRHETELRVRDNGRGISRRHLRTIFNKYERASAESNAPAQGFGLGLNFVRQVVEAHGGHIRAESEEGRWTEFIILMKNEE